MTPGSGTMVSLGRFIKKGAHARSWHTGLQPSPAQFRTKRCAERRDRAFPSDSVRFRPRYFFVAASRFSTAESFATFCRMIFPDLNFTVARAGMIKLLPGWFGFRPTR